MFAEFTDGDNQLVLVNSEKVLIVRQGNKQINTMIVVEGEIRINVRQDFEETKKRLGMSIVPRAETIMDTDLATNF